MFVLPSKAGGQLSSLNPVIKVGTKTGRPAASPASRRKKIDSNPVCFFFPNVSSGSGGCQVARRSAGWSPALREERKRTQKTEKKNKTELVSSMLQVVRWSFLVLFCFFFSRSFMADGVLGSGMAQRQPELDTCSKEAGAGAGGPGHPEWCSGRVSGTGTFCSVRCEASGIGAI